MSGGIAGASSAQAGTLPDTDERRNNERESYRCFPTA